MNEELIEEESEQEILRKKYRNLSNQLSNISEQVKSLINQENRLYQEMKKMLVFDNHSVEEHSILSLRQDTNQLLKDLDTVILPSVRRKG